MNRSQTNRVAYKPWRIAHNAALASILACCAVFTAAADGTLIGSLKSKNYMVDLYQSELGARYTVKSLKGDVLAEMLTEYEVLSQYPGLKGVVKGIADEARLTREPVVRDPAAVDPLK